MTFSALDAFKIDFEDLPAARRFPQYRRPAPNHSQDERQQLSRRQMRGVRRKDGVTVGQFGIFLPLAYAADKTHS
jgi:hypothetical protein